MLAPLVWTPEGWEVRVEPGPWSLYLDGDARLRVRVAGPREREEPTPAQETAYVRLADAALAAAVTDALRWELSEARLRSGVTARLAHEVMVLRAVHLHERAELGESFVGFELGCTWRGSGVGVLTHAGRVLLVGDRATGFVEPSR